VHSQLALAEHIADRDHGSILERMFELDPIRVRRGVFREDELWDYKGGYSSGSQGHESDWAKIAADVLAFHNHRGGILIFGILNDDFALVSAIRHLS